MFETTNQIYIYIYQHPNMFENTPLQEILFTIPSTNNLTLKTPVVYELAEVRQYIDLKPYITLPILEPLGKACTYIYMYSNIYI